MRNTARWVTTVGLTAAAVCVPLSGVASATPGSAPSALYAPSAGPAVGDVVKCAADHEPAQGRFPR